MKWVRSVTAGVALASVSAVVWVVDTVADLGDPLMAVVRMPGAVGGTAARVGLAGIIIGGRHAPARMDRDRRAIHS